MIKAIIPNGVHDGDARDDGVRGGGVRDGGGGGGDGGGVAEHQSWTEGFHKHKDQRSTEGLLQPLLQEEGWQE